MKLLKWGLAGAGAYVIYKYSIGKKAKGEDVFRSPERDFAKAGAEEEALIVKAPAKTKAKGKIEQVG